MRHFITCPRCATTLRVPPDSATASVTCPRCLAEVYATAASTATTGVVTETAMPPVLERVCQECGEVVGGDWRYCPNCQEPLGGRRRRGESADFDVRRDSTLVRVSMIFLAGLGGFGICMMLWVGVAAATLGSSEILGYLLAGLFPIGTGAALSVFFTKGKKTAKQGVGLAVYRSLAIAGSLILLYFLVITAFGIYLFAMCLQGKQAF